MPEKENPKQENLLPEVSRRDFLKISTGTVIAVGALSYAGVKVKQSIEEVSALLPRTRKRFIKKIRFTVNGKPIALDIEPRRTLLLVLREDLGLTGTKKGCNLGQCGACTVLMNGKPIYACLMLAADVNGKEILTIEGLEEDGKLHPIQQGFIEKMGMQCGHCTPGMIMSGLACLNEIKNPTEEDVKRYLSGNLCRCGNYINEIRSVLLAANGGGKVTQPRQEESSTHRLVGKSQVMLDAKAKSTGAALYAGDIGFNAAEKMEGILHCKILRSPYPHAKIKKLSTLNAEALPGVEAVITYKDVPKYENDRHFLNDKARYVGDPLVAVAAKDVYTAQEALELIDIEFQPLPAIFDPERALTTEVKIHEAGNVAGFAGPQPNNKYTIKFEQGDLEKGFKEADVVVEGRYVTQNQCHVPIESHCCVAKWEGEKLTVWDSQQSVHNAQHVIAKAFQIKTENVRVIAPYIGGGFGGKCTDGIGKTLYQGIAALLAKKTGKPVRLEYTQKEQMFGDDTRNPMIFYIKTGAKKDGRITAVDVKAIQKTGGYASSGPAVCAVAGEGCMETYNVDAIRYVAYSVYTNTPVGGELRGFGHPQAIYAMETHIDEVAEAIGMNPLDFRMKNHKRVGDPIITVEGITPPILSSGLTECIQKGAESIGWREKWKPSSEKTGRVRRGIGMRISQEHTGRDESNGIVIITKQGEIIVPIGTGNIGTEAHTGIAMIVAEVLGVNLEDLTVRWADSETCAWDFVTDASRSTHVVGKAFYNAAFDAAQQMKRIASKLLGANENSLELKNKCVYVKGSSRFLSFTELVAKVAPRKDFIPRIESERDINVKLNEETGQTETPKPHLFPSTETLARKYNGNGIVGLGYYVYNPGIKAWGAGFAEVEVDMESGEVKVLHCVFAHDVGKAINPAGVEAQIYGGGIFGLGYGLTEELVVDPHSGIPVNPTLHEYRPLTILDLPQIDPIIIEAPAPTGPFGAKGMGENPVFNGAPAVANAIYNTTGVRMGEIPMTWERVYTALKKARRLVASNTQLVNN